MIFVGGLSSLKNFSAISACAVLDSGREPFTKDVDGKE